jgi:photosystem II stability/assembly factor-like uncharacterized protein
MRRTNSFLLLFLPIVTMAQTTQWESMDGPYLNETRYHVRYPDGERIFVGTVAGTYRSLDGGHTWVRLTAPPAQRLTIQQDRRGDLYAIGQIAIGARPDQGPIKGLFRSTDRGASWTDLGSGYNITLAEGNGDTLFRTIGRGDIVEGATSVSRSTDRGATWSQILAWTDLGFREVYTQSGNVFLLMSGMGFVMTRRSSDGGQTWTDYYGATRAVFTPPSSLLLQKKVYGPGYYLPQDQLNYSSDNGATWTTTLTADSGFTSLIKAAGTLFVLSNPVQ